MLGNLVLTGVLRDIGSRVPDWVLPPHPASDNRKLVYVRMANGHGLTATLNETVHYENDNTVDRLRSYIPVSNNLVFAAYLQPHLHEVHFPSSPPIYLRFPFGGNQFYTGMLHRENSLPANLLR